LLDPDAVGRYIGVERPLVLDDWHQHMRVAAASDAVDYTLGDDRRSVAGNESGPERRLIDVRGLDGAQGNGDRFAAAT
jgi:hypothetical protein